MTFFTHLILFRLAPNSCLAWSTPCDLVLPRKHSQHMVDEHPLVCGDGHRSIGGAAEVFEHSGWFYRYLITLTHISCVYCLIIFLFPVCSMRRSADLRETGDRARGKIRQLLHTTFAPTKLSQNYTFARHPRCSWLLFVLCIERFSHRVGSSPLDRLTADCILLLIHRTSLSWK